MPPKQKTMGASNGQSHPLLKAIQNTKFMFTMFLMQVYMIGQIFFLIENENLPKIEITNPSLDSPRLSWNVGEVCDIEWLSLGYDGLINISLHTRFSYVYNLQKEIADEGIYYWKIPDNLTGGKEYVIKVMSSIDASLYGNSEEFQIVSQEVKHSSISIINPTSETTINVEETIIINWTWKGDFKKVNIDLYTLDSGFLTRLGNNIDNNGSYEWLIPSDFETRSDYYIAIYNPLNCTPYDTSGKFTINNFLSITVTNPNSLSIWNKTRTYEITWSSVGTIPYVDIYLVMGMNPFPIITNIPNDGQYFWTIQDSYSPGSFYQIVVSKSGNMDIHGFSDYFTITDAPPPVPEYIGIQETYNYSWNIFYNTSVFDLWENEGGTNIINWSFLYDGIEGLRIEIGLIGSESQISPPYYGVEIPYNCYISIENISLNLWELRETETFSIINNTHCFDYNVLFQNFLSKPYIAIHKNINWTSAGLHFLNYINSTYFENISSIECNPFKKGFNFSIQFTNIGLYECILNYTSNGLLDYYEVKLNDQTLLLFGESPKQNDLNNLGGANEISGFHIYSLLTCLILIIAILYKKKKQKVNKIN
ncbi:MAG: hypothetical protein GF317_12815 [Candidatus Lokiarchaeota archaeon]|nr:hypothetical protein [Candidatus Lokiarchaeota archaeon]MBD3200523.1 hypothetical protein [Candidatus Lokiarchaeota archaeon]